MADVRRARVCLTAIGSESKMELPTSDHARS
jgi:hypothetical protein